MAINVSVLLLLVVALLYLISKGGLRLWHAFLAAAFGFLIAGTAMAPGIRSSAGHVVTLLSTLHM